jgi:AraC-like DNA-binding protein
MPRTKKQSDFRMPRSALPGAEAIESSSSHVFGRHSHEQYGIGLILTGGQTSRSGRGMVEALAGDLIMVNPGEVHDGAPVGGASRSWRMLYLDPALVDAAARDIGPGGSRDYAFLHPAVTNAPMATRFSRLYAAVTAAGDDDVSILLREQSLLGLLNELGRSGKQKAEHGVAAGIAHARSLIDDAPEAAVSLACLAAASGLSRFQLVRQFARATGFTPHAYLLQRRVQAARRMIGTGSPLAEAALASGFADQSHMTRIFVRTYGMTPGAYAAASR